jgi:hypothetical protein
MEEKSNEEVAQFFNSVTDPLGNYALHICAIYGSCTWIDRFLPSTKLPRTCPFLLKEPRTNGILATDDVMDSLFDIQYFECDPKTRMDDDTPLHIAVRYANDKDRELGTEMVKMMCEAGCDPRVRNKHNQKPVELVFNNDEIKQALQQAEYIMAEGMQPQGDDSDHGSASGSE